MNTKRSSISGPEQQEEEEEEEEEEKEEKEEERKETRRIRGKEETWRKERARRSGECKSNVETKVNGWECGNAGP